MKFVIGTPNGSGMVYDTKEELLNELGHMIDDSIKSGATEISVEIDSDKNQYNGSGYQCIDDWDDDDDEDND